MDCGKCPIRFECELAKDDEVGKVPGTPSKIIEVREHLHSFCPLAKIAKHEIMKHAKAKWMEWLVNEHLE